MQQPSKSVTFKIELYDGRVATVEMPVPIEAANVLEVTKGLSEAWLARFKIEQQTAEQRKAAELGFVLPTMRKVP